MKLLECFDHTTRDLFGAVETHQEYTIGGMILTHGGSFLKMYEVGGI
jgi:hypothetical protein